MSVTALDALDVAGAAAAVSGVAVESSEFDVVLADAVGVRVTSSAPVALVTLGDDGAGVAGTNVDVNCAVALPVPG